MRKILLISWAIVVAVALNYGISQKEAIISNGELMYLKLAPVDPRSLMQGDYMRLNYEVANKARAGRSDGKKRGRGHLVLKVADNGVASFLRYHNGESLEPDETLIRYHQQSWRLRVVPDSFFFQEGHGKYYQDAKYGEFRVDRPGKYVLVGLADENLQRIEPN